MNGLDKNKTEALNSLYIYRESIEDILAEIEAILRVHYPDELSVAYQHWLPQIKTALRDNTKWLPRGQYSMDYTLTHIEDKVANSTQKGVNKYIK
jgi:hypothetical protein